MRFIGEADVRLLPDGRKVELLADFVFIDRFGDRHVAQKGCVTNGLSIPRLAYLVAGWKVSPWCSKARRASILHDIMCQEKTLPHKIVHALFNDMMATDMVGRGERKRMYWGVRQFGPTWVVV